MDVKKLKNTTLILESKNSPVTGRGGLSKMSQNVKISNGRLWTRFIKNNLTQRSSHIMRSILMSHLKVIEMGKAFFMNTWKTFDICQLFF